MLPDLKELLVDPLSGSRFKNESSDGKHVIFCNGQHYPLIDGIPIIIDSSQSLFCADDIAKKRPLTQDMAYRNRRSVKNFIRQRAIPSLTKDFRQISRYSELARKAQGRRILIIGAGDKIPFYKDIFRSSQVITSDVHLQFEPDIVIDAHQIPFGQNTFELILLAQVLEHTLQPWIVAKELERTVAAGGYIHVEVPANFPFHGAPYDFFRYTFTGLRSLFAQCKVDAFEVTEGNAATVAVMSGQFLVELCSNRYARMVALLAGRFMFGWLKYLDFLFPRTRIGRGTIMPKGIAVTFQKDGVVRSKPDLLQEFYALKSV